MFHRQGVLIFCRDLKEKNNFFTSTEKLKLLKIIALLFTDKDLLVYIHQLRGKRQKENSVISYFLKGTNSGAV